MFDLKRYLSSMYMKTGRREHCCCICGQTSIHSYESGWDFKFYMHNYYYKVGTRDLCNECLAGIASHPSTPPMTGKPTEEEEKILHKKLLGVFKDKEYLEGLKERHKILHFRERGDFYKGKKGTVAKLMGVQFENRQALLEKITPDNELYLSREPENPYDVNAISVRTSINNKDERIGYVPKALSEELAPIIDAGWTVSIKDFKCYRDEVVKYECISQEPPEFEKYWDYPYELDMFIVVEENEGETHTKNVSPVSVGTGVEKTL